MRLVGEPARGLRLGLPVVVLVVGLLLTSILAMWARNSHVVSNEEEPTEQFRLTRATTEFEREVRSRAREIELVLLGALPEDPPEEDEILRSTVGRVSARLKNLDAGRLPGLLGFAIVTSSEQKISGEPIEIGPSVSNAVASRGLPIRDLQALVLDHPIGDHGSSVDLLTPADALPDLVSADAVVVIAAHWGPSTLIAQFDSSQFLVGSRLAVPNMTVSILPTDVKFGDDVVVSSPSSSTTSVELVLFSRPWQLRVSVEDAGLAQPRLTETKSSTYLVVITLGLLLSIGAGFLVFQLNGSRLRFEVERDAAEDELRSSHERFQVGFDTSPIGVAELDHQGRVVKFNKALGALLQVGGDQLLGMELSSFICANRENGSVPAASVLTEGRREVSYCLSNGEALWVQESASTFVGPRGVEHVLLQVVDVTKERQAREELQQRALHDRLTNLPNRALLGDRIVQALAKARRSGLLIAVIFIDIDHFKVVNDSLGHSSGDVLLREVANRLRCNARAADTIARFGGDEFVMLCEDLDHPDDAVGLAERLRRTMRDPIDVGDRSIRITLSLGIAVANSNDNPEALLRDADLAMYQAKESGRDRVVRFERKMRVSLVDRLAMEDQLRRAIETGDLRLHYQPVLDMHTNTISGFESLVRWLHPMRGLLPPSEFLDIAEQLDLLTDIDAWTLSEAAGQLASWLRCREVPETTVIGVNASAKNFVNASYPSLVRATLDRTGLAPERLVIELTEDAVLANTERAASIIAELRQIGVRVAIDDFGTGYSSFSQLASLNFDVLKVDRSFTQYMHEQSGGEIVSALIHMAKALGLTTVVEGVESEEDLTLLARFGSDRAQGYAIAKPMPAPQVLSILKTYGPSGAGHSSS